MKKKTILFLDNTYPKPYQSSTLDTQGIGGTESSVVRTAKILSAEYKVYVAQKYRNDSVKENNTLSFIPKTEIDNINPDYIVVLRKYPVLKEMHQKFPKAKLFLWLHTYKNKEYVIKKMGLTRMKATLICNSRTHLKHTYKLLNASLLARLFSLFSSKTRIKYCYNPIEKPTLGKPQRDINKLLFFSSPNKGLQQVIDCFHSVKIYIPQLQLYVANPGYKQNKINQDNQDIIVLGSLPHKQMMWHVQQSLCVFYPQDSFSETFGLIYAEANAYGTPVLAHNIGAAREILVKNNPLINVNDVNQIVKLIKSWRSEFPKIKYNENFSDDNIFWQWQQALA